MFPLLFCVVDLETSNDFMPAAGERMILSRRLVVPGVEHAMQIIWGSILCLLVQRHKGSVVLQGSRIMNTPGILRSTLLVHNT